MTTKDTTVPSTSDVTESRIKDCGSARDVYLRYEQSNRARRFTMSQTRNQLEGGRPMDPDILTKNGEAWRTNVNFRDAETAFNRTYLPYWKMVHDVPNKIAPTVHSTSPHANDWAKAIAESFDLFLDDWGADYFFNFMLMSGDFVKFGPGYVIWADEDSPRFEHVRTENVLLPKRAKANVEKWDICCIEAELTVAELWEQVKDQKQEGRGEYVGWNPNAIKKAIMWMRNSSETDSQRISNWTAIQDRISSNDLAVSELWAPIGVVKMFVKNFDGSIAHYVFTKSGEVAGEFLFKSDDYADCMSDAIKGVFYDPGTGGLVHTIKGFGIKNYYFSLLQNRVKSRLMDAAMFATSMNFQQSDDTPNEAPPIQNFGAVNVFARGINQLNTYPNIGGAQSVLESLMQNQAETNYIYRDATKQIADTQTARQAVILANIAEEVGSATASIYLAQVADIFGQCFKRLIKKGSSDPDAKLFLKRLKDRGVPKEAIALMQSTDEEKRVRVVVRTGANPGTAGAALRDSILKELLGMIHLPGMNVTAIRDAFLANKLGTQAVRQFTLPEGAQSMPAQRRDAMVENSLFGQGMPLPVDPSDAHFEHCDEHLKPMEAIIADFQKTNKITPDHLMALQVALPHVSEHAGYLKQDETMVGFFKQIWPRLSNVQSVAAGIAAKLTQEKRQQQQQGAIPGQPPQGGSPQMSGAVPGQN